MKKILKSSKSSKKLNKCSIVNKKASDDSAITLIALVVTIIVLLLLAGITISSITGENGILTRASNTKLESRAAKVEEQITLWKNEKKMDKLVADYTDEIAGKQNKRTLEQVLDKLESEGNLTKAERTEIEKNGKVTIGSRTIDFGVVVKVGDTVEYTPPVKGDFNVKEEYSGLDNDTVVK